MTLAALQQQLTEALADVQPNATRSYGVMPKGEYVLQIERCEWKQSRSGGTMLSVGCVEPLSNRWIWANMNVINHSTVAQEIGQQQFAQLLASTDHNASEAIEDAGIFVGRLISAYVSVDRDNQNVIRSISPVADPEPLPMPPANHDDFDAEIQF